MRIWQILLILACLNTVPARAEDESTALTPGQRWEKLSDQDKEHLRENFNRFKGMDREERQQLVEQFRRFKKLPTSERQAILERHRKFQSLSPEQQDRVRERFRQFQKLPRAERIQRLQQLRDNRNGSGAGQGTRVPGTATPERQRPLQKLIRRNR